jgi:hypothetical protein
MRRHDPVESAEDLLLHPQILEDRLDDEIAASCRHQFVAELDQANERRSLRLRAPATPDAIRVVREESRPASLERVPVGIEHGNRDARFDQCDSDADAHRAGPDDGNTLDLAMRGIAPAHRALREEQMPKRA